MNVTTCTSIDYTVCKTKVGNCSRPEVDIVYFKSNEKYTTTIRTECPIDIHKCFDDFLGDNSVNKNIQIYVNDDVSDVHIIKPIYSLQLYVILTINSMVMLYVLDV